MQAAYLQSIKSPPVRGKFKIPDLPGLKKRHICDTDPNKSLQDTYLEVRQFVFSTTIKILK